MSVMRALIAARKSNKAGNVEGQSLSTQDQHARAFCERLGLKVVGTARDTITGRVAPVDRKQLGSWLSQPWLFDCIVAYRSDRLSRGNQEDWTRIEHWATDNSKTLILVDSSTGIRYPARDDSDYWQWTAEKRRAGREWDEIRERNVRAQQALVTARAVTSRAPYGYRITGPRYQKVLQVVPHEAEAVREAFKMVTSGKSLAQVSAYLSDQSGRVWDPHVTRYLIMNWAYAGRLERKGQHYADCPAIVTPGELVAAQKAMRSRNKKPRGGRPSRNPALLVPTCGRCGGKMYRSQAKYYCRGRALAAGPAADADRIAATGCGFGVPCASADAAVKGVLSRSSEPEMQLTVIPGVNHADEIERLKRDRRQALERDDIDAVVQLTAKIKDLEAQPTEPDRTEPRPTGRTVGESYAAMTDSELRAALRGWTVMVYPNGRLELRSPWRKA